LTRSDFKKYYQFPDSIKSEFKVIPWLLFLIYLPMFFEPFNVPALLIVLTCHVLLSMALFRAYWADDNQVAWYFIFALALSFFTAYFSLASIVFYATTILIAMAHSIFRVRVIYVFITVAIYLCSAWIQSYPLTTFLVGLFFTLVNGISLCYQMKALYQQIAIKKTQEEVRLTATSSERERIAHDLHDLLGQSLTGISLKAELAIKTIEKSPAVAQQQLNEILAISRKTLKEVRAAVSGYRQSTIANEIINARVGFGALGINFTCEIEPVVLESDIEQALAWIVREGTTNIMRHSKANHCEITLKVQKKQLTLMIRDNGGQNSSVNNQNETHIGTGIISMRQRCHAIQAEFSLFQDDQYLITVRKELT
jgi:two-component system sensor histidine kinase DesK